MGEMKLTGIVTEEWGEWNEKGPKDQWQMLDKLGMITLGPFPGVTDEGNNREMVP